MIRPVVVTERVLEVLITPDLCLCLVMLTYLMFFLHMVTGSAWHVCCEID